MNLKNNLEKEEVKDKPKRIICKPGNVFCVEVEGLHKRFFQYLGKDFKCLGGGLVRVFKKRYPMGYEPVIEDITSDEVDFYHYTWVSFGVPDGLWYRVGTSKDLGNLENIFFLAVRETIPKAGEYSEKWKLVEAFTGREIFVGKLPAKYQMLGCWGVSTPEMLYEMICIGYFPGCVSPLFLKD